jgi:hypothetical protein
MRVGLAVAGRERVGVGENWVATACVDIPARVCAAAVYKALRVAAGCGVAAANGPLQARIAAVRTAIGIRSFLECVLCMNASVYEISHSIRRFKSFSSSQTSEAGLA